MVAKKTTKKKVAAKKRASSIKKTSSAQNYVSFKVTPNKRPFLSFELTQQTVYWAIIGIAVLLLGTYVVYLQIKVNEIYDQVDVNSSHIELNERDLKKLHNSNHQMN